VASHDMASVIWQALLRGRPRQVLGGRLHHPQPGAPTRRPLGGRLHPSFAPRKHPFLYTPSYTALVHPLLYTPETPLIAHSLLCTPHTPLTPLTHPSYTLQNPSTPLNTVGTPSYTPHALLIHPVMAHTHAHSLTLILTRLTLQVHGPDTILDLLHSSGAFTVGAYTRPPFSST